MKPKFSIILPCWNSINFIERCINSIKCQTYQNYEVIIVDNSSDDGTLEKIHKIKDDRFKIFNINNKGILARSRNLGIIKSSAEWIAFLDSDDWWTEDKLEVCLRNINEKVDFIYHDLKIVYDYPRLFARKKNKSRHLKKPVFIDLLINGNAISNSSVVVRRKLLNTIDGINESKVLPAAEDYNAWLKIAQLTNQFTYLPFKLGYYFINDKSMSSISHKDMSIPMRQAVVDFLPLLDDNQKLKVEANLRYTSGRFNYFNHNYEKAKKDLFFVLQYGNISLKFRSLLMTLFMIFK